MKKIHLHKPNLHCCKEEGGLRTKGYFKQSFDSNPLITVITVVLNGEKYLEKTIQSVIQQSYDNVEYLIIDGGSFDKTIEIIKQYENQIDYWISEKDHGIYDAMNKGINLARGNWLYFLGSDDILYDSNVLLSVKNDLSSSLMMIYGNSFFNDNRPIRSTFNLKIFLHNTIHHQAAFYNFSLFQQWRYDNQLKLIADYELNLILYKKNLAVKKVELNIAISHNNGLSRTLLKKAIKETNQIRKRQLGIVLNILIYPIFMIKFFIYFVHMRLYRSPQKNY